MVSNKDFFNFNPEKVKVVEIVPVGRSSSLFLQGLLEKHEKIITLPAIFYPSEIILNKGYDLLAETLYTQLSKHINAIVNFDEKKYDYKSFKKYFIDYLRNFGINRKNVFIAYHYSFAKMQEKDIKKIEYIICNTHGGQMWRINLLQDFPNLKILLTVRDPRENLYSEKLRKIFIYDFFGHIETWKSFMKFLDKLGTGRKMFIKHEELHRNYPGILEKICRFLKIEKTKELEYASFFGMLYTGGRGSVESVKKIKDCYPNPKFADEKWKSNLSSYEIAFAQWFFSDWMKRFDYKFVDPFREPRFVFMGNLFRMLTKENIENAEDNKKKIFNILIKIAKIPIFGFVVMYLFQLVFYTLKLIKSIFLNRIIYKIRLKRVLNKIP